MAILKKPEPKKPACKCVGISPVARMAELSSLMTTVSVTQAEMGKAQLETMKADLRKHVAEAELAEVNLRILKRQHGIA